MEFSTFKVSQENYYESESYWSHVVDQTSSIVEQTRMFNRDVGRFHGFLKERGQITHALLSIPKGGFLPVKLMQIHHAKRDASVMYLKFEHKENEIGKIDVMIDIYFGGKAKIGDNIIGNEAYYIVNKDKGEVQSYIVSNEEVDAYRFEIAKEIYEEDEFYRKFD